MTHRFHARKAARTKKAKAALLNKALEGKEPNGSPPNGSPFQRVQHVFDEATQLKATVKEAAATKAEKLVEKSRLKKSLDTAVHAARGLLQRAETIWSIARTPSTSADLLEARRDAEALKQSLIAALRHWEKDDQLVQARLDEITAGTADIADDLRKLAGLAGAHAASLKRAKEFSGKLVKETNRTADRLVTAVAEAAAEERIEHEREGERKPEPPPARASWDLRLLKSEVLAAGRYVFGSDKGALDEFRATLTSRSRPTPRPTHVA